MEWLKNLSNAIDYIEKNLDGEICYEEAAKAYGNANLLFRIDEPLFWDLD